ncbi:glycosyltransferase [Hymenobacter cellulosivorans]|uniref:Glycosyltransferase n=1 Tax=Hymenobacter cellulosivorans TaxID=2932249 RepID=A0ABY4F8B0_9BACT|nr:glycosyltransferase [Hymenobacter cellulosivorans]UOQ52684.1 glycosyltransferase [Hymenobacter cellulosivorans]
MEHHPLNVLLLGWDEAAQAAAPPTSPALDLSRQLAEYGPVSVIVPQLPNAAALTSADQVIRLNLLSAAQLATAATARRSALPGSWQAPAAPYVGASVQSVAPESANPESAATVAALQGTASTPALAVVQGTALPSPTPPAPTAALTSQQSLLNEDIFAEATSELGPEEAAALDQAADNLTLLATQEDTAPVTPSQQPVAATPAAEKTAAQASFVQALKALDNAEDGADLNFRVIQYARFATPLAGSQPFGVVYAADWHAWLAALEIRQLTGRPLVLHVQTLAADRDSPADRGWILELERLALRRADLVLANTDALAQRLTSFYNIPAARIRVVAADDTVALNDALTQVKPRS